MDDTRSSPGSRFEIGCKAVRILMTISLPVRDLRPVSNHHRTGLGPTHKVIDRVVTSYQAKSSRQASQYLLLLQQKPPPTATLHKRERQAMQVVVVPDELILVEWGAVQRALG